MKNVLLSMVLCLGFISCDITKLTKGVCDGQSSSVGIEGDYKINTLGEITQIKIVERSWGTYTITYIDPEGDSESFNLEACQINGKIYADTVEPLEDENVVMSFSKTSYGLEMKSVLFDQAMLAQIGIPFNVQSEMGREVMTIDNRSFPTNILMVTLRNNGEPLQFDLIRL